MAIWQRWRAHTHGGVHPPQYKNTADSATVEMPPPEKIQLPMLQHIGAPCIPVVKIGDEVAVGQVIGDSDQAVCAPIHSGISGKVTGMPTLMLPGGRAVQAVEITSDGQQRIHESVKPPQVNSRDDFLKAVRASGLVGIGGAGFPTHIKLAPANVDAIDTLIINAAECEPFITSDYRECMENPQDILDGIRAAVEFLPVRQVVIAVERNKPDAIQELSQRAAEAAYSCEVRVKGLPTRYPQGAEKVLIAACTGRRVPPGQLPAQVGCVVMNVSTVAALARYLRTGMPLVQKRLTLDGPVIAKPGNVLVTIGTPIREVVAFCGGYQETPGKIFMGGPMMGLALMDDELPVLKQNNAILAFGVEDAQPDPVGPCIRCGRCIRACPMQLMPTSVDIAYHAGDVNAMRRLSVATCMECGCCSYSCPAHRPLVQTMRLAKDAVRRAAAE